MCSLPALRFATILNRCNRAVASSGNRPGSRGVRRAAPVPRAKSGVPPRKLVPPTVSCRPCGHDVSGALSSSCCSCRLGAGALTWDLQRRVAAIERARGQELDARLNRMIAPRANCGAAQQAYVAAGQAGRCLVRASRLARPAARRTTSRRWRRVPVGGDAPASCAPTTEANELRPARFTSARESPAWRRADCGRP